MSDSNLTNQCRCLYLYCHSTMYHQSHLLHWIYSTS